MEIAPTASVAAEAHPPVAGDPVSAADLASLAAGPAIWDWGNLFDFSIDDGDSLILPWGGPDEAQTPPPEEIPPSPLPSPLPAVPSEGAGRVRKRDPKLVCPNYLAGRVPCSCPEMDEMAAAEEEEEEEEGATVIVRGAKKRTRTGGASSIVRCQVPGCEADISTLKGYHRRHRVCLGCANASSVLLDGERKRYCQQCGKFHLLSDFDEGKRSCRRKLERHNKRRRRKPNDLSGTVEKETEAQVDSPAGVPCNIEQVKDTPNEFTFNATETVLSNKILDVDTPESEDGQGSSPIGSIHGHKIDELASSAEVKKDERNANSKSSLSTTFCENKSTYSSMCPTGRISFKLYDWNPAEFPRRLRHQIFQWLANMPVELEGYIRPGCTILTVFVAMPQFMWEKLSQDAAHYVGDLINAPESLLLGRGTILIYLSNMIIQVLRDGSTLTNIKMEVQAPRLHYVYPSYFEAGQPVEFVACGSNLEQPKFRFLVSFGGKYIKPNSIHPILTEKKSMRYDAKEAEHNDSCEHEMLRVKLANMETEAFGPAFIEVENVSGISNFIPVLVGNKEVCSELKRMEEVICDSSYVSSSTFQNVVTEFFPDMCAILSSRQYMMSSLLLDIAWLLKTPHTEEKESFWSSINAQRITSLLEFLLKNELFNVLQLIVLHLDAIILIKGSDKPDNRTSDDFELFHKCFNHTKSILYQRMPHSIQSEPRMPHNSQGTDRDEKNCTNQGDDFSTSCRAASHQDENVPLITKGIVHRQPFYQNLGFISSFDAIFSDKVIRTRFPLFVVVSVVLCLAACVILLHPHKAGEFAVSIRRCMFGDPPP